VPPHPAGPARRGGGAAVRKVVTMMPIGVPKVPYKTPGENSWQWVDLWNCLYRERIIFIGQTITEDLGNQVRAAPPPLPASLRQLRARRRNLNSLHCISALAVARTRIHTRLGLSHSTATTVSHQRKGIQAAACEASNQAARYSDRLIIRSLSLPPPASPCRHSRVW
jgi:hypothetical protein